MYGFNYVMKQDGAIEWRVEVIDGFHSKSPVDDHITDASGPDNAETGCGIQRARHCHLHR